MKRGMGRERERERERERAKEMGREGIEREAGREEHCTGENE